MHIRSLTVISRTVNATDRGVIRLMSEIVYVTYGSSLYFSYGSLVYCADGDELRIRRYYQMYAKH